MGSDNLTADIEQLNLNNDNLNNKNEDNLNDIDAFLNNNEDSLKLDDRTDTNIERLKNILHNDKETDEKIEVKSFEDITKEIEDIKRLMENFKRELNEVTDEYKINTDDVDKDVDDEN